MDFEQAINTQRLRLLRMVAGLLALVGFVSVAPFSRGFTGSICQFVASILSRAEAAAQLLVIAQARRMGAGAGIDTDRRLISERLARAHAAEDADISLAMCRRRLKALRSVLMDLPRCSLRLLRRIEKRARRALCADRPLHGFQARLADTLCAWRLAPSRIERPPDKTFRVCAETRSSRDTPSPGAPAGGQDGWSIGNLPSGEVFSCPATAPITPA